MSYHTWDLAWVHVLHAPPCFPPTYHTSLALATSVQLIAAGWGERGLQSIPSTPPCSLPSPGHLAVGWDGWAQLLRAISFQPEWELGYLEGVNETCRLLSAMEQLVGDVLGARMRGCWKRDASSLGMACQMKACSLRDMSGSRSPLHNGSCCCESSPTHPLPSL